jgi:hypothetical protein
LSETRELIEGVAWFRQTYPEFARSIRPSMNGLSRRGKAGAILWNSMKAQGAGIGDPDFALLLPKGGYGCLLIEHKAIDQKHDLSAAQIEHIEYHTSIGNCAVSTRGIEAFKAAITTYLEQ